ncbi:MAG: hypothetical protein R3236_04445 [Phycisphaeraceae bacterium]|nr:hypothetical protein [Phycisphaeraceae bacterium]
MDVFLDDHIFETDATDLGRILDQAKEALSDSGRIVVEVRFDDQVADAETLQKARSSLPDAEELRLISADPARLCAQALEQADACLGQVLEHFASASELIHEDRTAEAMQRIGHGLGQWRQIIAAVTQSAAMLGLDLKTIQGGDLSAEQLITQMAQQLRTTQQHLLDRDHIGLADVLGYEWDQTVERWRQLIRKLIEQTQTP